MLTTIHITVRDRVPTITAGEDVISHNSDYVAEFEFDEEWQDKVKTAYFVCEDGSYQAVVMSGNSCGVPMLDGEHRRIFVGVQAGSAKKPSVLKTTRPCCLKVKDSIADYLGQPIPDPTPDVYEQIIAMLESITSPTWDAVQNKPFSTLGGGLEVDENGVLSAQGGGSANAVQYVAQTLTDEQKAQARENIGAGTSDFDGNYNNLTNKPTIPTAVTIDSTLTQQGQAADAKAVGDELAKKLDNPQTATIGDVLTVEEVDGDGKPTKWKSVDANAILTIDNTGYKGTDYYALPDGVYNLLSLYVANKDGMNLRLQGVTSVKNHSFVCAEKNTNVIFGSDGSVVGYDYGVWRWSEKENVSNKVTSLSATSKDNQYPSAKAVYDALTTAIPKTLPNPHKLTFTGAVTGEYDGSSEMTVDIPQGGDNSLGITTAAIGQIIKVKSVDTAGKPTEWEAADLSSGDKWETVREITIPESVEGLSDGITYMLNDSGAIYALKFTTDANGNNLNYKKLHMLFMDFASTTQTTKDLGIIFNESYITDNHVDISGLVKNDSCNGVCDVECLGDNDGHTKVQFATLPMSGYGGYAQPKIMTPNSAGYGRNGFKAQSIVAIIMRSKDINVGIKPGGKIFVYGVRA